MSKQVSAKKGMTTRQADLCLLVITCFWGFSYILMDVCTGDMDAFTLNALRFLISGGLALVLGFGKVRRHLNRRTILHGILVGVFLVGTYAGVTFGVQYTTLSNSGFLSAMTVIFTPFFSLLAGRRPGRKTVIAACICMLGIALLTLKDDFSINAGTLKGDLLCISCGFFYAFVLLFTEKGLLKGGIEPYTFGVVQLLTVGIINLCCAKIFYTPHLPSTPKIWAATLFLAFFCTGLAYILQPIAQQYTTASRVGLIFSLETVFNAFAAFAICHEVLSIKSYFGAAIMIFSVLLMEVDVTALLQKKRERGINNPRRRQ